MAKYSQGKYQVQNPQKYIGTHVPIYRSSWEAHFMRFCDNDPRVLQWSSESIRIPYINPLTGRNAMYYPDFFVVYIDGANKQHGEIIEVKPASETTLAAARSERDKMSIILNMAKWQAAQAFCKSHGLIFRTLNETQMFHNPTNRRQRKRKR